MPRIEIGDVVRRTLTAATGEELQIPDPERLTHLQFRRYAGCPVCNRHLRATARRLDDLAAAGVREVIVFLSTAAAVARYHAELPLPGVADPDRELYRAFGVGRSARAVLDPRIWPAAVAGTAGMRSLRGVVVRGEDHLGLPADFLIDTAGRVLARQYGSHADDQWSVDQLLILADTLPAR